VRLKNCSCYIQTDEKRHRVSLGMKKSYFDFDMIDGADDEHKFVPMETSHTPQVVGYCNLEVLHKLEPKPSVLPLPVSLDDSEGSDQEDDKKDHENAHVTETNTKKNDKRLKEKARKQRFRHLVHLLLYTFDIYISDSHSGMVFNRELEISAIEERTLQQDIPQTPDEFEKLVRSSPNSSFLWIKYMACLLDLADVEKARAIAERSV
jgi:rRNA biogenesis protein RRP5